MTSITDYKVKTVRAEEVDDVEIPTIQGWDTIPDRPRSLADLSHTDGERLDTVESEVDSVFADITIRGWSYSGEMSAVDNDTVQWNAGTLKFSNGTTYNISLGNTGNMAAITYIYFDPTVSETAFQTTTNAADAVGSTRLMIGVAQNVASGKDAIFQAFGGKGTGILITADNIAANSITANELFINSLSSITANIGTITSGSINGVTITGGTVRTSSGSTRVEMNGSDNSIYHYQSGVLRTSIGDGYIAFYRPSDGVSSGSIFGSSTSLDINAGNMVRINNGDFIFGGSSFVPGSSVSFALGSTSAYWAGVYTDGIALKRSSGSNYCLLFGPLGSGSNISITLPGSIGATGTVLYNTGSGILGWKSVPSIHYGYVNSGATMGTNPSGFSVSSSATGIYTVTHDLGTTAYSVVCTARASVVKNITVSARNSNSFTVRISNLSDALEDNDFMFILATT